MENFYNSIFEPNWGHCQETNSPEKDGFAVFLMHLELRREYKKDYVKVGESKTGIELQDSEEDYLLALKGRLAPERSEKGLSKVF